MVFRYSHKSDEFGYLFESAAVAFGIAVVFVAWSYYDRTSLAVEEWESRAPAILNKD